MSETSESISNTENSKLELESIEIKEICERECEQDELVREDEGVVKNEDQGITKEHNQQKNDQMLKEEEQITDTLKSLDSEEGNDVKEEDEIVDNEGSLIKEENVYDEIKKESYDIGSNIGSSADASPAPPVLEDMQIAHERIHDYNAVASPLLVGPPPVLIKQENNYEDDNLNGITPKRPRRIIFDSKIRLNGNEGKNHGLKFPKFNGMGTHEIVQRMAERGQILYVDGTLKWIGTSSPTPLISSVNNKENSSGSTINSFKIVDCDEDLTIGGPITVCSSMNVSSITTTKWRYRKKVRNGKGDQVDPQTIVPKSAGSLGSTGSASETELCTDEDEDDNDLVAQGWIIKGDRGRSIERDQDSPISTSATSPPNSSSHILEYELIDESELIATEQDLTPNGPPTKKRRKSKHIPQPHTDGKIYPKPGFSYSCLIAMSLKNSQRGSLPVSEIYKFMCDHFPYFKTAPSGWKNSVRHNLSLNKCFEKIEKPGSVAKKGCLWGLNPAKITKMDEEVQKWLKKDPSSVIRAMSDPENLQLIERGELKRDYSAQGASDEEEEEDCENLTGCAPTSVVTVVESGSKDKVSSNTVTVVVSNGNSTNNTTLIPVNVSRVAATNINEGTSTVTVTSTTGTTTSIPTLINVQLVE